MTLAEIIKLELDNLYKHYDLIKDKEDYEELEEIEKQIKTVSDLVNNLSEDVENFRYLDALEFKQLLDYDMEKFESNFKMIQLVLTAKYDEHLAVNLTSNQAGFLQNIITDLKQKDLKLRDTLEQKRQEVETENVETIQFEDNILALEFLYDRIVDSTDEKPLDLEDFHCLYSTIIEDSQLPLELKKQTLFKIIEYNSQLAVDKKKKVSAVDISMVKQCLEEFGVNESVLALVDKNKNEISTNINLSNAREILRYLSLENPESNKKNIVSRFSPAALLSILLYSNQDVVRHRFEDLQAKGMLADSYFQMPSIWVNNLSKNAVRKRNGKGYKNVVHQKRLSSYAHEISYDEMLQNEKFLTGLGLDVSISRGANMKLLKTPHYRILENFNIYANYQVLDKNDVSNFSPSAFSFSSVADRCDKLIEIGLLHEPGINYVSQYPSIINSLREESYALLSKLKKEYSKQEYYDLVFSGQGRAPAACLTRKASNKFGFSLGSPEEIQAFKQDNFIEQTSEEFLPNSSLYEDIITKSAPISYSPEILEDENISLLEQQYRDAANPFVYKFSDQTISRPKVLRCYQTLKSSGKALGDDALMYTITRGTYLDDATFQNIASQISYSYNRGESKDGISTKV